MKLGMCVCVCCITGLFAYSCGCVVVVEHLHTGVQRHFHGHTEEVSCLAISHDTKVRPGFFLFYADLADTSLCVCLIEVSLLQMLASAASGSDGSCSLIRMWDVQEGACCNTISLHRGAVQCLAFSRDDRFLLSVGQ